MTTQCKKLDYKKIFRCSVDVCSENRKKSTISGSNSIMAIAATIAAIVASTCYSDGCTVYSPR